MVAVMKVSKNYPHYHEASFFVDPLPKNNNRANFGEEESDDDDEDENEDEDEENENEETGDQESDEEDEVPISKLKIK